MFPNWFSVMKGDRLDANLGRVRSENVSQFDNEGGEVFDSGSEHSVDGETNDIEMSDQPDAAPGHANTSASPPLPNSPPPPLAMGPCLADGYIATKEREAAERAKHVEHSDHADRTGLGTNSTECAPTASTSRPPDQTLPA